MFTLYIHGGYRLVVDDSNSSKFEKSVGGTITTIGSTGLGVDVQTGATLRSWQIVSNASAGTLQFYDNGTLVLSVSTTFNFTGGKFGLGGNGRQPIWDNFAITP